jgi:hypothetical protein
MKQKIEDSIIKDGDSIEVSESEGASDTLKNSL